MTPPWLCCLEDATTHLAGCYPREGCGLVVDGPTGFRFQPAANLAPAPLAAVTFELDPLEIVRAEARGERLVALVHSHVDTGDEFSEEDLRAALALTEPPEPWYPGVDHLVVSVVDGVARSAAVYRFAPASGFVRVYSTALPR